MARDLLINLSLSPSPALHTSGVEHRRCSQPRPPSCSAEDEDGGLPLPALLQTFHSFHFFVTLSSLQAGFFFSLSPPVTLRRRRAVLTCFILGPEAWSNGGVWVIARQRADWSLTGSLHQRRCLSPCRLASACQYGCRYDKQTNKKVSSVGWAAESKQREVFLFGNQYILCKNSFAPFKEKNE